MPTQHGAICEKNSRIFLRVALRLMAGAPSLGSA